MVYIYKAIVYIGRIGNVEIGLGYNKYTCSRCWEKKDNGNEAKGRDRPCAFIHLKEEFPYTVQSAFRIFSVPPR